MNTDRDTAWLLKEKFLGIKTPAFFADCARLEAGEPLAYVIGHIPFLNTTINLDSHPLIPRPETEWWVEQAIAEIRSAGAGSVLDLCAGSGAIGIAVAKNIPTVSVTFGEIDPTHLPTIKRNLAENQIESHRATVVESDLFQNVAGVFEVILTNPPYLDPTLDRAEASVTLHEPHLALYGGTGGMELIARIINEAPQYLTPEGQLWIEHEPEQGAEIQKLAEQAGFTARVYPDQFGTIRYSVLTRRVAE